MSIALTPCCIVQIGRSKGLSISLQENCDVRSYNIFWMISWKKMNRQIVEHSIFLRNGEKFRSNNWVTQIWLKKGPKSLLYSILLRLEHGCCFFSLSFPILSAIPIPTRSTTNIWCFFYLMTSTRNVTLNKHVIYAFFYSRLNSQTYSEDVYIQVLHYPLDQIIKLNNSQTL